MDPITQETVDYVAVRRLQDSYADIVTRRALDGVPRHLRARHRRRHRHPQGRADRCPRARRGERLHRQRDPRASTSSSSSSSTRGSGCGTTATTTAPSAACTSPSSGARRGTRNGRRRTGCTTTASRVSTLAGGSRGGAYHLPRADAARRRRVRVPDRRSLLSDARVGRYAGSVPEREAACVPERQAGSNCGRFRPSDSGSQVDAHAHADADGGRRAPDDVRHEPRPLVELDQRDDVRLVTEHARQVGPVLDEERVDRARPGRLAPLEGVTEALQAHLAWEPHRCLARGAPLEQEPVLAGGVPERARHLGGRRLERALRRRPRSQGRLRAEHERRHARQHHARPVRDRRPPRPRPDVRRTHRGAGAPPRRSGTSRTCRGACTTGRRRSCSSATRRPARVGRPRRTRRPRPWRRTRDPRGAAAR